MIKSISYINTFVYITVSLFLEETRQIHELFSAKHARPNIRKYVIVLTDGRSNEDDLTIIAANNLNNMTNVTTVAIGIGPSVSKLMSQP